VRAARKRRRRLNLVVNDLTADEWAALKAAWNGCAYCGATDGPLQRDCVLAISRGGRYTVDNVVPACASCNTSKCNEEVTTWLRRKRLDERRFLKRYVEIRAALLAEPQAGETPALSTRTALIRPSIRLPSLNDAAAADTPSGADSSIPRPCTSPPYTTSIAR
jgi:HNH endonuclease